jgi:hypothetical protein
MITQKDKAMSSIRNTPLDTPTPDPPIPDKTGHLSGIGIIVRYKKQAFDFL